MKMSHVMFSFSGPTQFVLWSALQLWKILHFEIDFVLTPMVQVHRVRKLSFHIMNVMLLIATNSVWRT